MLVESETVSGLLKLAFIKSKYNQVQHNTAQRQHCSTSFVVAMGRWEAGATETKKNKESSFNTGLLSSNLELSP